MQQIFTISFFLLMILPLADAQDIIYEFDNPQITGAGPNGSYELDVTVSTTGSFKLGSGQFYISYNPAAFGNSVQSSGNFFVDRSGTILGQTAGFPIYNSFTENDNTPSVVSVSWGQGIAAVCFPENVSTTPEVLIHLRFDYIPGGQAFDEQICFVFAPPFDDQTFTACGPFTGSCTFTDCSSLPGTQITNDIFDCSGSNVPLPLELLDFTALNRFDQEAELQWLTDNEYNVSHFDIERSVDGIKWAKVGETKAIGFSSSPELYKFTDAEISNIRSSIFYYRLRMVDLDQSFEYSEVRSIRVASPQNSLFATYPNPGIIGEYLNVELFDDLPEREQQYLVLTDMLGRVIRQQNITLGSQQQIPIANQLVPGGYILLLKDEKGRVLQRERLVFDRYD